MAGLSADSLARFVNCARRELRLRGSVDVLVTGNPEMKSFNQRFLKKDAPTDVLSFPSPSEMKGSAGELAISVEIAAQNARRLGHSTADEVRILALHGVLHLAGYDHERDGGEMARKEMRLRKALKLPVGLIERSVPASPRRRKR